MTIAFWRKNQPLLPGKRTRRRETFRPIVEGLEERLVPATFTVDTTADVVDAGDGLTTFREAIFAANASTGGDLINFNLAANDANHVYYRDDGVAGTVSTANITSTTAADDSTIGDIDPDWTHSWWSIKPTSTLPGIIDTVEINGYSQPGASPNTIEQGASNAVLRIELDGSLSPGGNGLQIGLPTVMTVKGLAVNGFNASSAIAMLFGTGHQIQGNFIGTDISGTIARANHVGVALAAQSQIHHLIGGSDPAARNLISGNDFSGIQVLFGGAVNATIQGNLIGTDASGEKNLGNRGAGIRLTGNQANVIIGGTNSSEGNIIGFNGTNVPPGNQESSGIVLAAGKATIQGNFIGTDTTGTKDLGNVSGGIFVKPEGGNVVGTTIGGSQPGAGNMIAFNGIHGIALRFTITGVPLNNSILGNQIYANKRLNLADGLGIDLDTVGVNLNDTGDVDGGANNGQNFPVLDPQAVSTGSDITITGKLNSEPNKTYRIEFFSNSLQDVSDHGEGERYLGFTSVTTDGDGDVSFSATLTGVVVPAGHFITATATDPNGNTSEFSGNDTVVVLANQPPVADAGGPYFVDEGGSVGLDASGSSDPDQPAATLTYEWDFDYDGATFDVDAVGATPLFSAAGLDGPLARTVAVRVTDNAGASSIDSAELTVQNVPPTADAGGPYTVAEDDSVLLDGSASSDPGNDIVSYEWDFDYDGVTFDVDATGVNPLFSAAGLEGPLTRTVAVRVTDNDLASSIATENLSVTPVNDAPVAGNDSYSILEDMSLTVSTPGVLGNDTDVDSGSLTAILETGPANGSLTFNGDGSFIYTPGVNFNGTDSFTYKANDGSLDSDAATVTIEVIAVNDIPSFDMPEFLTIDEDAGLLTIPGFTTNMSAGPPDEAGQTLSFQVAPTNTTGTLALTTAPTVDPTTGDLTFETAANTNGTARIFVTLIDNGGTANGGRDTTNLRSFFFTVNPVNDAPTFVKGANQVVNEDAGPQTVPNWATNISPGPIDEVNQTLAFEVISNNNPSLFAVAPMLSSNGSLSYTPAVNAFGSATIEVQLRDDGGTARGGVDVSGLQSFTITVNPVNDAPEAQDDSASTTQTIPVVVDVKANDQDVEGDTLTVTAVTQGGNGTVTSNPDGTVTYTPAPNFVGTDSFSYTISDGQGGSDTATVTVTVAPSATPGHVTGGGSIASEHATNFGFNIKGKVKQGELSYSGNLEFQDKDFTINGVSLNLHSTSYTFLSVSPDGKSASFTGQAKVNGVSGYSFTVQVEDNGEPGTADKFRIVIRDALGDVLYDSDVFATNNGTLDGGNVQIH